ncbi:LysR family transcriptional regulator [Frateuria aurantia]
MRREDIADLTIFIEVARAGGFTSAARKLGLSQSSVSHTLRRLEARLGFRLLTRTTRSVAITEAGRQLLATLQPAMEQIDEQLTLLAGQQEQPAGTIRISTSEHAAEAVLWPAVHQLVSEYPDIQVELNVDAGFIDIVKEGFDAGVRIGEAVARDLVALPIGPPLRMAAFASPAYLAAAGVPGIPSDLERHRCIVTRFRNDGSTMPWEFERDGMVIRPRVQGPLVFNRHRLLLQAVEAGQGIGYSLADLVQPLVEAGTVQVVLQDWCPPFDGYHLYYPSRRQPSRAFRLLLETLRRRYTPVPDGGPA